MHPCMLESHALGTHTISVTQCYACEATFMISACSCMLRVLMVCASKGPAALGAAMCTACPSGAHALATNASATTSNVRFREIYLVRELRVPSIVGASPKTYPGARNKKQALKNRVGTPRDRRP